MARSRGVVPAREIKWVWYVRSDANEKWRIDRVIIPYNNFFPEISPDPQELFL